MHNVRYRKTPMATWPSLYRILYSKNKNGK